MLSYGTDLELANQKGNAALMSACQNPSLVAPGLESVELLLNSGANTQQSNADGDFPLMVACSLRGVSATRQRELIIQLVDHGADRGHINKNGDNALIKALASSSIIVVDTLATDSVDVNITNKAGDSPLVIACKADLALSEKLDTLEILLASGADPYHVNELGEPTLDTMVGCLLPDVKEADRIFQLLSHFALRRTWFALPTVQSRTPANTDHIAYRTPVRSSMNTIVSSLYLWPQH